jgi:hypothetical protein
MRKLFGLSVVLTLFLVAAFAQADTEVPLIAGQHYTVGTVTVSQENGTLIVEYEVGPDCEITETHLYVGTAPPTKSAPGQFPYKDDDASGVPDTVVTYEVDLSDLGEALSEGQTIYIAAHAVVCCSGESNELLEATDAYVEDNSSTAYFTTTVPCGGESYDGWCVDIGSLIAYDYCFDVTVTSTATTLLPTIFPDAQCRTDMVNYILNQYYSGAYDGFGNNPPLWGEVQKAIWIILEGTLPFGFNPQGASADAILEDASLNGCPFEPECGDLIAYILWPEEPHPNPREPFDEDIQISIIPVPVPCLDDCETAWGEGDRINAKGNWSMFFEYEVEDAVAGPASTTSAAEDEESNSKGKGKKKGHKKAPGTSRSLATRWGEIKSE